MPITNDRCYLRGYGEINIEAYSQYNLDYSVNDIKGSYLNNEDLYFMPRKSFVFRMDNRLKRIIDIEYDIRDEFVYPVITHRAKIIYKNM